jgi:hypothetical protein
MHTCSAPNAGTYAFVDTLPVVKVPWGALALALLGHAGLARLVVLPQGLAGLVAQLLQCGLGIYWLVRLRGRGQPHAAAPRTTANREAVKTTKPWGNAYHRPPGQRARRSR